MPVDSSFETLLFKRGPKTYLMNQEVTVCGEEGFLCHKANEESHKAARFDN
jgi:hypothetical protein